MKYTVFPEVFELAPNLEFGIVIARGVTVTPSTAEELARFNEAQEGLRARVTPEEIRSLPNVAAYREVLQKASINPNKFTASVEAMLKRVAKGSPLPAINALVDLGNVISIENGISLGGHDLDDIHQDLEVRFSREGDVFLPFGETQVESVEPGELVFTAGPEVQTRKWVWRQSELGKITTQTRDVFFQMAGFTGDASVRKATQEVAALVEGRLGGTAEVFYVNAGNPSIEFQSPAS